MAALTSHYQVASEICERPVTRSIPELQQSQSELLSVTQQGREHVWSNGISRENVRQTIKFTNGDISVMLSAISNFGTISSLQQHRFQGDSTVAGGRQTSERQPVEYFPATEALRRYRNKGQVKKCFGIDGHGVGRIHGPYGLTSTASDDIVVADFGNHRVQIFDVNGRVKGVFGDYGLSDGEFDRVIDVCVTSRGCIVASDFCNHRIQIFDEQGKFVRKFGSEGSGDGELNFPVGVATDEKGLIYVCDRDNRRVQVFSQQGNFLRKFSSADRRFDQPNFLSVTSTGRIVFSDYADNRVVGCNLYGGNLFQVGTNWSQFEKPRGIATDEYGNIIVVDKGNHRVQVFTSNGEFVSCFGSEGSEPGQMMEPEGVCLLSDGRIAVSDWGNNRVQIF